MGLFHNVTRGGQVHIHQIRMIRQVLWFSLLVGFCTTTGYMSVQTYRLIPLWAWRVIWEYRVAELNIITQPEAKKPLVKQWYVPLQGIPYERTSFSIVKDPLLRCTALQTENFLVFLLWKSLKIGGWSSVFILGFWFLMGQYHRRRQKHRGTQIISSSSLARKLKWTFKASVLKIGALPLVKGKETSHILISGTTGAGKSNTFHILMPQIREKNHRALIVDMTGGSLISRFYQPEHDLILNPFDERSQNWNPWWECLIPSHFDALAEAIIPQKKSTYDPFWDDAGRSLLSVALQKLKATEDFKVSALYTLLTHASVQEFHDFFAGTEAATFADKQGERTTMSIRSNLARHLVPFKYIPDAENGFSIRQWIAKEDQAGWLFLTARNDQRAALKSLLTAWIDIAFNAVTTLPPDPDRRIWFIIDELPGLYKIPSLGLALAESRKYGGCLLAGVQNFSQLREIYGLDATRAMLDQFNTQFFFRSTDPETTTWISKILGEAEETEVIENISYGANTMRDGVSLNQQTKTKPLVLPTEIATLPDLECFVKYPGNFPITKLKMAYQKAGKVQVPFQIKEQNIALTPIEVKEDVRFRRLYEIV